MSRLRGLAAALAIVSISLGANWLYAAAKPDMKCFTDTCANVTSVCTGTGTCYWCNGSDEVRICGMLPEQTCDTTGQDVECGAQYRGTCNNNVCVGNTFVQDNCKQVGCTPGHGGA
jgi:hypothetical protein